MTLTEVWNDVRCLALYDFQDAQTQTDISRDNYHVTCSLRASVVVYGFNVYLL